MAAESRERTFVVRWWLRAGHRNAGTVNCRTRWVSTATIAFTSRADYQVGELVELEICIDLATYVRCVGRILESERVPGAEFANRAEFVSMTGQDRAILAGTLLAIRRAELAEDYGPQAWARGRSPV